MDLHANNLAQCGYAFAITRSGRVAVQKNERRSVLKGHGSEATGKVDCRLVLKGHGFSHAAQVLHFCHPSGALAPAGSPFKLPLLEWFFS